MERGYPYVAVVGGLWQLENPTRDKAKSAAGEIGKALADHGFNLVVYYSNDDSLEPHVVDGYVQALPEGRGKIVIRYSEAQRGEVKFKEEEMRPEIFEHRLFPGEDWEAPFYRSLAEAEGVDAVLLLSGATSTLIAGQIALARRLPILAVDEFGGSAAKIWAQLAHAAPGGTVSPWRAADAGKLVGELAGQCACAASARAQAKSREARLTRFESRRRRVGWAAAAFAMLLLILFSSLSGFVAGPFHFFLMLTGLAAAGATGALVHSVLAPEESHDPLASAVLGGVAGFAVGLGYLIPQAIGAPEVLGANPNPVQLGSAILVALSAGIGFDTVYDRLRGRAQDVAVAPPP